MIEVKAICAPQILFLQKIRKMFSGFFLRSIPPAKNRQQKQNKTQMYCQVDKNR
jgi:hypothetical protein